MYHPTLIRPYTTMIRLFFDVCKSQHLFKHLNEVTLYHEMSKLSFDSLSSCPICGAPCSKFYLDGKYSRDFITYEHNQPFVQKLWISCVECSSCGHSHALLPDIIIPYSSFSLKFILSVIYARITGRFSSVECLCAHFQISIATFYRFFKRFISDFFLLKTLVRQISSVVDFLDFSFQHLSLLLHDFYKHYGHSFLQPSSTSCSLKSFSPDILRMVFPSPLRYV